MNNVNLPCAGMTSPWNFGDGVEDEYAEAVLAAQQAVNGRSFTWYFLHMDNVARQVPQRLPIFRPERGEAVISVIACDGRDFGSAAWTDGRPDPDILIAANGRDGRLAEVLDAGGPGIFHTHWQTIFSRGTRSGLHALAEVLSRLHARFGNQVVWTRVSDLAEYAGAAATVQIAATPSTGTTTLAIGAPFPCSGFTLSVPIDRAVAAIRLDGRPLRRVADAGALAENCYLVRDRADLSMLVAAGPAADCRGMGTCLPMTSVRAFAVQYKQDIAFAESYSAFSVAMERLFAAQIAPYLAPDRPNLVVLNEITGLLTCFIGARGALARTCGWASRETQRALALLRVAYEPQIAWYLERFPGISPQRATFLATTDVMASRLPGHLRRAGGTVRRLSGGGDRHGAGTAERDFRGGQTPGRCRSAQPAPRSTSLAYLRSTTRHRVGAWRRGAGTEPEGEPYAGGRPQRTGPQPRYAGTGRCAVFDTPAGKLGIAISLDAFVPSYVEYLDQQGVEIFLQPEANSGPWAAYADTTVDPPAWQPQTWMASCWQAVQRSP